MIIKNIFFDYYNKNEYEKGFGQITFHDECYEKIDVINLDIGKNEFRSIYLAFKECSDKNKIFWEEHNQ